MIRKFLLLLTLALTVLLAEQAIAQSSSLKNKKILQIPELYIKPVVRVPINTSDLDRLEIKGPRNDWVVYSDRENNPTYQKPGGKEIYQTMGFMESFYVVDDKGKYVRLVKYDPTIVANSSTRRIDYKKALDYGWVEKAKLLLWRNCLVNEQTDFKLRAMTVHQVSALENGFNNKQKKVKLYNTPASLNENENDIRLLEFLYVYKKEEGRLLVGVGEQLRPSLEEDAKIKGWISEDYVQIWAQRLCIEPNDDSKAANERKTKGVKTSLLSSHEAALAFSEKKGGLDKKVIWDRDTYEKGYEPQIKRSPILATLDNDVYQTGVITDIYNKNREVIVSAEEHAILEKEYNDIRDKRQLVDIFFVIDGSAGNHSYIGPIVQAIENSKNLFDASSKTYRFGTVIYGNAGQGVLKKQALSKNVHRTLSAIKSIGEKEVGEDNGEMTDMYVGLEEALRGFDKGKTNMIVLIGDTGNSLNGNDAKVIERMKTLECGLISFQTRNIGGMEGRAYQYFINQSKKIIKEAAKRSKLPVANFENIDKKYTDKEGVTYRLKFPQESIAPGSLTYLDRGEVMSQVDLEDEIRAMFTAFEIEHERLMRDLDCKIYVDCETTINEAVLDYILSAMPEEKVDDSLIDRLWEMDYQLFVESYAPMKVEGLEYPLFKHVLFLDDSELYEIKQELQKLVTPDLEASKLREDLINAYKQILIKHFGNDLARGQITNKTPGEIIKLVTGLPSATEILNDFTIGELADRRKVPDAKLEELFYHVANKVEALDEVTGNPAYFFRSRNETYYWVPQEVLP